MINPNQLGRSPFPAGASQWMLVGLRGAATPVGLNDGDPVTTWTDSSTGGHNATQTGSARPTFKTNILNGKPVVRFTVAGTSSLNLSSVISGVDPWTIFAVMKPASLTDSAASLVGNAGGGLPLGPFELYDTISNNDIYIANRTGYMRLTSAGTYGAFHVLTADSRGGGASLLNIDGTLAVTGPIPNANAGDFAYLGYNGTGTPAYSNADVAEIIIYRPGAAINTTDRANVEKYLGTKYGITVAGGSAVQPDTVSGLVGWWKADSLGT